jgi:hypothetical protein
VKWGYNVKRYFRQKGFSHIFQQTYVTAGADRYFPDYRIILAVVFGAANAYLGLKVGMTISASIPAAVISMGIIRGILKRDSILENNMVQTIGSAGESLAAGAIFTLPALFIWSAEWGLGTPSLIDHYHIILLWRNPGHLIYDSPKESPDCK